MSPYECYPLWDVCFERRPRGPMIRPTWNLDAPLELNPHYTDARFVVEQSVYGESEPGLTYEYSDRLHEWDREKARRSWFIAGELVGDKGRSTARKVAYYLTAYFGKLIEVRHIVSGVNRSNGYAYNVYGFRSKRGGNE